MEVRQQRKRRETTSTQRTPHQFAALQTMWAQGRAEVTLSARTGRLPVASFPEIHAADTLDGVRKSER